MSHKCFISFKKEDTIYRDIIADLLGEENITAKSLDEEIDSDNIDYVMQQIRQKFMNKTTVTIFLIGGTFFRK